MGSCSLLQGNFPIQGSNPGLAHWYMEHNTDATEVKVCAYGKGLGTSLQRRVRLGSAYDCVWRPSAVGGSCDLEAASLG